MDVATSLRKRSLPALTMPQLWAVTAVFAIFIATSLSPIFLGDFWWHLKVGQIIAQTGHIPSVDSFSFVASGQPYVYQQWLAELYFFGAYSLGGLELVVFFNSLLFAAIAALVLVTCGLRSGNLRLAAMCSLAGLTVGMSNRDARPQVFGFLLFAFFAFLLTRHRLAKPSPLWLLPVLEVLWVNLHGSAVLGPVLLLIVTAGELAKARFPFLPGKRLPRPKLTSLAVVTAATIPAMLANPWGVGLVDYLLTIQRNSVIQTFVTEWFPPSLGDSHDLPVFLLLFVSVALLVIAPKAADITDVLLFIVFGVLALQAARNSVWFGIIAAPICAAQLTRLIAQHSESTNADSSPRVSADTAGRAVPNRGALLTSYSFVVVLSLLGALTLPWVKPHFGLPAQVASLIDPETPVAAVRFACEHAAGARVFHPEVYGGYKIWACPNEPVFVDERVELYPAAVWRDYLQILAANQWEQRLASYGITIVILQKHSYGGAAEPLLAAIRRSPAWLPIYEDQLALIYAKQP